MFGRNLQHIRVSADRAVLKRGTTELLLSGEGVHSVLDTLLPMLDGRHKREHIVAIFPEEQRNEIDQLLTGLLLRGLIREQPEPDLSELTIDSVQAAFWSNFGAAAEAAQDRLRRSNLLVVGANLITRALIPSLLEMGVGRITLVDHAVLNTELAPLETEAGERLIRVPELPSEDELAQRSLLCAASDFGQSEALLQVNRLALRTNRPFLPLWLGDLRGYAGPLTYPYESACLRCYRARTDSNTLDYQAAQAVRRHLDEDDRARFSTGLLPPMAAILGQIGAMEIAKFIGGFPPADVVGRVIEVNLVSFASAVRRVLKIPRCPDCGEVMNKATRAIHVGPLIPHSE